MRVPSSENLPSLGIVGFGAFGRVVAKQLAPWFRIYAYDSAQRGSERVSVEGGADEDVVRAATCQFVVLAPPVDQLCVAIQTIRPHLRPGTIVFDVCSVKVVPMQIMERELPEYVEVIGTHPLFGPQSSQNGIAGRKIVFCPMRSKSARRIAAFLRSTLRVKVLFATAEEHDREMATVQGLTHLIARLLVQMEPLPTRMTTASYDLLLAAAAMVRNDSTALLRAIELTNPFAAEVRNRFLALAEKTRQSSDW
jgi:prephenate dehydrogenase